MLAAVIKICVIRAPGHRIVFFPNMVYDGMYDGFACSTDRVPVKNVDTGRELMFEGTLSNLFIQYENKPGVSTSLFLFLVSATATTC